MNFLQWIVDLLRELWPLRAVEPFERGVMTVWRRPWLDLGPGIYPVIPYFMDVLTCPVAPATTSTALQNIVLSNGQRLSFSASAKVQVIDARKALLLVDNYQETTREDIAAQLADQLADVEPDRFSTPRKRKNLMRELLETLNATTQQYGVEVQEIAFTNWLLELKTYRLLTDSAIVGTGDW